MVLRAATPRRWPAEEVKRRLADAPSFAYASPSAEQLAELKRRYTEITGGPISEDPQRPPRKQNLLAACYRVHGNDTLCFIRDEFTATRTAVNLLGTICRLGPDCARAEVPRPAARVRRRCRSLAERPVGRRAEGVRRAKTAPHQHRAPPGERRSWRPHPLC